MIIENYINKKPPIKVSVIGTHTVFLGGKIIVSNLLNKINYKFKKRVSVKTK